MTPQLTNKGIELLKETLANRSNIEFTKIQFGNGEAQEALDAVSLNNMQIETVFNGAPTIKEGYVALKAIFTNENQTEGFRVMEIGYFAKGSDGEEILYAIGFEDEGSADYIPASSERILEYEIDALIFIGDVENVTAAISQSLSLITKEEFEKHTKNYNNPHQVTKAQVGLPKVPNVTTNEQMPTFVDSDTLEDLVSGTDILSVLFGKLSKAIKVLRAHLSNKEKNPHGVTAEQVKAADINHSHSTTDIKSGVLSVVRGGTGNNSIEKNAVLVGDNTDPVKAVKGIGAFFSDGDGAPKFDTLPVNMGGTGLTKGASFVSESTLIEGSYGCYGSVILPGGLLVQWGRLKIEAGEGQSPKIKFEKSFADKKYALLFTTSSGSEGSVADMPSWNVPTKEKDYFYMYHPFGHLNSIAANHVADWVAFGRAADN